MLDAARVLQATVPTGSQTRAYIPLSSVNIPGKPGYHPGLQRHRLLSRTLLGRRPFSRMIGSPARERIGFHDFRRSVLQLPASEGGAQRIGLPLHRVPNGTYSEVAIERVGQIEMGCIRTRRYDNELASMESLMLLDLLQRALRRRLLTLPKGEETVLNKHVFMLAQHDPSLDYNLLDLMAEILWQATESKL